MVLTARADSNRGEEIYPHLVEQVFGHYRSELLVHPKALEYLAKRGIHDPELIERCEIGFSNRTFGNSLSNAVSQHELSAQRGYLQREGLYTCRGGELFRGCLVVPVRDSEGLIIGAYGKRIMRAQRGSLSELCWSRYQGRSLHSDNSCQELLNVIQSIGVENLSD